MVHPHSSQAPDPDSEPEEENTVHMSPENNNHNMWIAGVFYDCRSMVHTMLFFLNGWIKGGNQNRGGTPPDPSGASPVMANSSYRHSFT